MRRILQFAGFISLLVFVSAISLSAAQDEAQVTIVGSAIGNALIESLAQGSTSDAIETRATGTTAGINQFCSGGIDVVSALRPMSAAEAADCIANEVQHNGFLIAHKIVAFAAYNAVPATCISRDQLEAFAKPSVSNQQLDWSGFADEDDSPPFTLSLPAANSLEYGIVDELVAGDGLRRDADIYSDPAEVILRLAETEGALAILPFSAELASNAEVKLLGFSGDDSAQCVEPSAESVESRRYTAARSIYVYVGREQLGANESLFDLLSGLIDEATGAAIVSAGYTAPSSERIATNAQLLANPTASAALGDGETDFEVPAGLSGEINISGAANAYQLLERVSDNLTSDNVQLLINIEAGDSDAAFTGLCSGEVNIAMVDMPIDAVASLACEDSEIVTLPLSIGTQATILLGNSADAFAQCLTLDQITTIWQTSASDGVTSWSDIDESLPAQEIVLFGLSSVDRNADMLLARPGQVTPPIRRDTERDFDPLYRAAAVGNVPGSLTYMSWQDYQKVLDNQQQNVKLVSVDAGSGCVSPSARTIADGSYALSRAANLIVNQDSLADVNIQSLLWSLYADGNWSMFVSNGFVGIDLADLSAHRRQLETQFRLAEASMAATEAAAEAETTDDVDDDESD